MGVSKNNGTPKSSILIGFSIINHPFWGFSAIFGNTHIPFAPQDSQPTNWHLAERPTALGRCGSTTATAEFCDTNVGMTKSHWT